MEQGRFTEGTTIQETQIFLCFFPECCSLPDAVGTSIEQIQHQNSILKDCKKNAKLGSRTNDVAKASLNEMLLDALRTE